MPNAKILYATEKDFSPQNRVKFFNNIKNNDWDCVIMSHDQFGKDVYKRQVIEKSPLMYGGTCINIGCIPTKKLIHTAANAKKRLPITVRK